MKAEYPIDLAYGERVGSVEGLICMYPADKIAGELALEIEQFYQGIEEPIPGLIMLNTVAKGGLHEDIVAVRATKDLWSGIFTSDQRSIFGISHYDSTIRELFASNPHFLAGRIVITETSFDRQRIKEFFRLREKQKRLHLQFGSATVTSSGALVVESDLAGFQCREQLLSRLQTKS